MCLVFWSIMKRKLPYTSTTAQLSYEKKNKTGRGVGLVPLVVWSLVLLSSVGAPVLLTLDRT